MSHSAFTESVKVVELLQRPFALLPMSSDLPRLTNIRVVDEHGRSDYEQPGSGAPTLVKLRYTFVALAALLLDDSSVEAMKKTFDEHFTEGMDVSKLSMEGFLEKIGGDRSPVVQVLKAVNQSAISPAIIHLKLKLGLVNMTKDVRDSWFYEVIVSASTGQVVVASHKRDQSIKNDFQYEWVMAVHFDRIENPKNEAEEEANKATTPRNKSGSSALTSSSSSIPSSPSKTKRPSEEEKRKAKRDKRARAEAKKKEKEERRAKRSSSATSKKDGDGHHKENDEEEGYSTSDESEDDEDSSFSDGSEDSFSSSLEGSRQSNSNGHTRKKHGATGSSASGGSTTATNPASGAKKDSSTGSEEQASNEHPHSKAPSDATHSGSGSKSNKVEGVGVIVGSQTMDLPEGHFTGPSTPSASAEEVQQGGVVSSTPRNSSTNPASGSTEATPRTESGGGSGVASSSKANVESGGGSVEVDGDGESNSGDHQNPQSALALSPEKILSRHLDFGYKCTNVSLNVTDLMFSLPLHTTQQAKRAEICRILEPYANQDVMELSFSRNWEFFPASASAELFGQSSTTSPSTGGAPKTPRNTGEALPNGVPAGNGLGASAHLSSGEAVPQLNVPGGLQSLGGVAGQGVSSSHSTPQDTASSSSLAYSTSLNHSAALSGSSTSISQASPRFSGTPHQLTHSGASASGGSFSLLGGLGGGSSSSIGSSSASQHQSQAPPPIIQGIKEYDNGDRYEGGLCLGIREGFGKYTCSATKVIYEGGYKDGKRHGVGKYAFASGALVQGTFQRGVLVHGSYSFPNGDTYTGDFKDDKFDGQGEWLGASGDVYKGAWKAGQRHGLGEAKLSHGDSYTGEFQNDAIHGFGKYLFANGDLFNGQFSQGLIHGVGEYTFHASGKVLLGEFAQGKLVKSSAITNPTTTATNNSGVAALNAQTSPAGEISSSSQSPNETTSHAEPIGTLLPNLSSSSIGGGIAPIPEEESSSPPASPRT